MLFEELSIPEIIDVLESYQRREKYKQELYTARMKDVINILDGFSQNLIGNLGCVLVGGEHKNLQDMFPKLFQVPNEEKSDEKVLSPDMQVYKAQRINHAYRVNKQRAKEG